MHKFKCHTVQIDIRKVYVFLDVTCYLHVWQNDRDRYCGNRGQGVGVGWWWW